LSAARHTRFELAGSPRLAAAVLCAHAAAAACVALVLPNAAGALLGAALSLLGAATAWSRGLLRGADAPRAIEIEGPAQATLETAHGARHTVELSARRYVGRHLVALGVRRPGRRTILITSDMLDAAAFRALRLWALWGRLPGVAGAQLPA
jgi:hypothetical protein